MIVVGGGVAGLATPLALPASGRSVVISYIQTNPIYGRGCSMAFVQAHALADVLATQSEPRHRSACYHATVARTLKQPFEFCVNADRMSWARTKRARGDALDLCDRILLASYDAVVPALDEDRTIARAWLRGQQMLEPDSPLRLLKVLAVLAARILRRALSSPRSPALPSPPQRDLLLEAEPHRPQRSRIETI